MNPHLPAIHSQSRKARRSITFGDILTILFKHRKRIAIVFLATVLTAAIASFLITPKYESNARILLKFGREYVYRPEFGDRSMSGFRPDITGILNAEMQIMTSRDLINKVIQTVGLNQLYPDLQSTNSATDSIAERARNRFMSQLAVKGVEESGVIQVTFQHKDPKIARQALDVLIDLFQEKHLQTFTDPKAFAFLEQKVTEYSAKLQQTTKQLEDLKLKHTAYSIDEQKTLLLKQRTDLDSLLKASLDQTAAMQQRLAGLQSQKAPVVESAKKYTDAERLQMVDRTKSKLMEIQLKEQEMARKYADNSPLLTDLQKDKQIVQDYLQKQENEIKDTAIIGNPMVQDLEMQIIKSRAEHQSAQARVGVIRNQLGEVDNALRELAVPEDEIKNLQREMTTNEQHYQTYQTKLEEARISEDMNRQKMSNISVIQKPAVPTNPISPNRKTNILIAAALGLLLGVGVGFLSEEFSQTISTPQIAERKLALPVLVAIPYEPRLALPKP